VTPPPPASPPDLAAQIAAYGPSAQLVTVTGEGRPHVVAVTVALDGAGDQLTMTAGTTSRTNVAVHPAVTLLWAAPAGSTHSLMVDGEAAAVEGGVTVRPSSALLHRAAHAAEDVPRCLAVTVPLGE
jgi:hypothetical protein